MEELEVVSAPLLSCFSSEDNHIQVSVAQRDGENLSACMSAQALRQRRDQGDMSPDDFQRRKNELKQVCMH